MRCGVIKRTAQSRSHKAGDQALLLVSIAHFQRAEIKRFVNHPYRKLGDGPRHSRTYRFCALLEDGAMTVRVSVGRWLLRDVPRTVVLLFLTAFVAAIFSYFIDWPSFRSGNIARPINNDEQHYTGSIVLRAANGMCWTILLDNRTGKLRNNGYSKCVEAEPEITGRVSPDATRLREVGKAFRHEGY